MDLFFIFSYVVISAYFIIIVSFSIAFFAQRKETTAKRHLKYFLTVVVPARNEEATIELLLFDLMKQTLPCSQFEIIIVDDQSSDYTLSVVRRMSELFQHITILHTEENLSGKKNALLKAIHHAKGQYIVCTDADCRVPENWLKTIHDYCVIYNPDLLIGPVKMTGKGIFSDLQSIEFQTTVCITGGSAIAGFPTLINAANMSFKKSAFIESEDPFNRLFSSGDDMFLLHYMKKKKKKIRFLKNKNALVETETQKTLKDFFRQRLRWSAKSVGYRDFDTVALAVMVFLANLNFVVGLALAAFFPKYFVELLIIFVVKTIADFSTIVLSSSFFSTQKKILLLLVIAVIYPFYTTITAFSSLFVRKK